MDKVFTSFGCTIMSIAAAGSILSVAQEAKAIKRRIWANGGTMWVLGQAPWQGLSTSFGIPLIGATPYEIDGPAAFYLMASASSSSAKVESFYEGTARGVSGTVL